MICIPPFRLVACVLVVPLLFACSALAGGLGVAEFLTARDTRIDQPCSIEGIVAFDDGFRIVDLHDKNKYLLMAIPVRLFDEVKSLVGQEVVVDGVLQSHKFEERANSIEFSPTQLLISKIKSKSAGK